MTNSRSMPAACSLVTAERSSPTKVARISATSQAPSTVRSRCSPRLWPGSRAPAASAAATSSLGTSGSRIAAANRRSLVP